MYYYNSARKGSKKISHTQIFSRKLQKLKNKVRNICVDAKIIVLLHAQNFAALAHR